MESTGRTEAFSDGVFAIAITLLIVEVKVLHAGTEHGLCARKTWLAHAFGASTIAAP